MKGEFENRLRGVIDEVKAKPIILFVTKRTMIGAGGAAGQNDAANLLKPALARGELRRTSPRPHGPSLQKYFERRHPARRFRVVEVEEPTSQSPHRDDRRWSRP